MRIIKINVVSLLALFIFTMPALTQENPKKKSDFPVLKGKYLGQVPPGKTPIPFFPDIFSLTTYDHGKITFSTDGKEVYWACMGSQAEKRVVLKQNQDGIWSSPEKSFLSVKYRESGLSFSPDGQRAFFHSRRPPDGAGELKDADIWYRKRIKNGWSAPINIGVPINTRKMGEYAPTIASDGTLYFCREVYDGAVGSHGHRSSQQDIYYSKYVNGRYTEPVKLGSEINTEFHEIDPAISPDNSFLVFVSRRPDGYSNRMNLFVSFRKPDDTWTQSTCLSDIFKIENIWFPSFTHDGKYLLFNGDRQTRDGTLSDHYWVDVKIIEELKSKQLQLTPSDVKLRILYDNNPYVDDLQTDPGFSCLIRIKNRTLLFDAGRIGKILMSNIEKLEINPADIENIVISHNHSDHICGLPALLEECNRPEVYIVEATASNVSGYAQGLIDESIESAEKYASKVIRTTEPHKICANVYTTGVTGDRIPEQALIIQTDAGLIVITGCGHPGVVELTEKAIELFDQDVLLVIGGFHLTGKQPEDIQEVVTNLSKLTRFVAPCHCSGDVARELFEQEFG